jgi:hypothetical protein
MFGCRNNILCFSRNILAPEINPENRIQNDKASRKTNRSTVQPFQMRPQGQVLPFDAVGAETLYKVQISRYKIFVIFQAIGINLFCFGQFQGFDDRIQCLVGSFANRKTDYFFRCPFQSIGYPNQFVFSPDKGPHFIDFISFSFAYYRARNSLGDSNDPFQQSRRSDF